MPETDPRRLILQLPPVLLSRIDEWRYDNRIPSRAEAMRMLLERGLGGAYLDDDQPRYQPPR